MSRLDEEISGQFADLRAVDAAQAPEFADLWTGAQRRAPAVSSKPRRRTTWWLAAAASVVMAGGMIVWHVERLRTSNESADGNVGSDPGITTWMAPTDALLHMSKQATSISPSLLGSALGSATRSPGSN
jgi:hypothetical protein